MFTGHNSSSGIYLALILEKIFGGMTERFMKEGTEEGGISQGDVTNQKKMKAWMEKEMDRSLSQKEEDMEMIVRGLKRTMENPNERTLMSGVEDLLEKDWLDRVFRVDSNQDKLVRGNLFADTSLERILRDEQSPFRTRLRRIISRVLEEDLPHQQNNIIDQ